MQPAPPSPAPPTAAPRLSSTVLYAIVAIAVVVIAAIFGFILIYVIGLTHQLWWIGLCALVFALLFYMVFASTHNRSVAMPMAGAFFVIGVGSFYGSIAVDPVSDAFNKLVLMVLESIFVVVVLVAIFAMARQGEADAIRKSQRKITP